MPRKPFTCRSTRPGNREARAPARQADRGDPPVVDLDVAPDERPVHDGGGDTELHARSLRRPALC